MPMLGDMDEEMKAYAPNAEDATTIAHNASRALQELMELLWRKDYLGTEELNILMANFEPRKE